MDAKRECPRHGLTDFFPRQQHGEVRWWRCRKCQYEALDRYRIKLKSELVALLGSKCSRCGYDRSLWALDFHHVDRNTKEERLATLISNKARARAIEEVKKCVLLCKNCHAEIEHELHMDGQLTV